MNELISWPLQGHGMLLTTEPSPQPQIIIMGSKTLFEPGKAGWSNATQEAEGRRCLEPMGSRPGRALEQYPISISFLTFKPHK